MLGASWAGKRGVCSSLPIHGMYCLPSVCPPHLALGKLQQCSLLLLQIPVCSKARGVGDGGQVSERSRSPLRHPSGKDAPLSQRAALSKRAGL